jgi:magnesium transporter
MGTNNAADLLADLPQERVQEILAHLPRSEAQELQVLLSHSEESAGGLMTPEYLWVRPDTLAREVIEKLRNPLPEEELFFYIYVTDEVGHLEGVFSLQDQILTDPEASISEFMTQDRVCVSPETDQDEVVHKIMKYNLKALPVVDEQNKLRGIVTIDDVIDLVGPEDWRREGRWLS